MFHYPYLIIGGGMTADAAARGIREVDANSAIGIIGSEPNGPYARPPLSKALWKGGLLDSVWLKTNESGIDMHLDRRAKELDVAEKRVVDHRGTEYGFDKVLLATGGTPRRLPLGGGACIIYFR